LDDETCARALRAIRASLAGGGSRTRAELLADLAGRGVRIDSSGQAPAHLLVYAALRGLICRAAEREDEEPAYALLDEWAGPQRPLAPEAALTELTRRYVQGHGPATPEDLAQWAGFGLAAARRGFGLVAGELVEVETPAGPAWMPRGAEPAPPAVRLLPAFDAYLLGYRDRDLLLPRRFARRIQAGGGWIHATLVVAGLVAGTWRLRRRGAHVVGVDVEPFETLPEAAAPGLETEVADVLRFLAPTPTLPQPGGGSYG
jgi:hypothetical protein